MSALAPLTAEAVRDASRRRIVAVVVVMSVVSLFFVDGCTSCAGGEITVNGENHSMQQVGGITGAFLFATLGLWVVFLAGVLASDHLQQSLEDGAANLTLARPVTRDEFVLARLLGTLFVAGGTAGVLLGSAAFLLYQRSGLDPGPAVLAALGCGLSAITLGALGMWASLWLPRLAAILTVVAGLAVVTLANTLALFSGSGGSGILHAIDQWGPPLASALWIPLLAWVPEAIPAPGGSTALALRAVGWAGLAIAALLWSFRRHELGR